MILFKQIIIHLDGKEGQFSGVKPKKSNKALKGN